jgi:hypothetical protein
MPLVESAGPGLTPGPLAFSATVSCRKEKKKQAKEERDRLKQAEKKKRRLEKALATAAAIRAELEKKKQRRKEEERRLDEEGAALAEAVALQVGDTCLHPYVALKSFPSVGHLLRFKVPENSFGDINADMPFAQIKYEVHCLDLLMEHPFLK